MGRGGCVLASMCWRARPGGPCAQARGMARAAMLHDAGKACGGAVASRPPRGMTAHGRSLSALQGAFKDRAERAVRDVRCDRTRGPEGRSLNLVGRQKCVLCKRTTTNRLLDPLSKAFQSPYSFSGSPNSAAVVQLRGEVAKFQGEVAKLRGRRLI